jgi:hypothetical protein
VLNCDLIVITAMDENPRPSKRARKSCERCRQRKQKCHGFPVCEKCANAKENCVQPPSAIEEYNRCVLEIIFLNSLVAGVNCFEADQTKLSSSGYHFSKRNSLRTPIALQ